MAKGIPGTRGYTDEAEALLVSCEDVSFEDVHSDILHLLPNAPCNVLDIGSGTGRDAGYLAGKGHRSLPSSRPTGCGTRP